MAAIRKAASARPGAGAGESETSSHAGVEGHGQQSVQVLLDGRCGLVQFNSGRGQAAHVRRGEEGPGGQGQQAGRQKMPSSPGPGPGGRPACRRTAPGRRRCRNGGTCPWPGGRGDRDHLGDSEVVPSREKVEAAVPFRQPQTTKKGRCEKGHGREVPRGQGGGRGVGAAAQHQEEHDRIRTTRTMPLRRKIGVRLLISFHSRSRMAAQALWRLVKRRPGGGGELCAGPPFPTSRSSRGREVFPRPKKGAAAGRPEKRPPKRRDTPGRGRGNRWPAEGEAQGRRRKLLAHQARQAVGRCEEFQQFLGAAVARPGRAHGKSSPVITSASEPARRKKSFLRLTFTTRIMAMTSSLTGPGG